MEGRGCGRGKWHQVRVVVAEANALQATTPPSSPGFQLYRLAPVPLLLPHPHSKRPAPSPCSCSGPRSRKERPFGRFRCRSGSFFPKSEVERSHLAELLGRNRSTRSSSFFPSEPERRHPFQLFRPKSNPFSRVSEAT